MNLHGCKYLIICHDIAKIKTLALYLKPLKVKCIVVSNNTRSLAKMMFDHLIEDYFYCDFKNELSILELQQYLSHHHDINASFCLMSQFEQAPKNQQSVMANLHHDFTLFEVNLLTNEITQKRLTKQLKKPFILA